MSAAGIPREPSARRRGICSAARPGPCPGRGWVQGRGGGSAAGRRRAPDSSRLLRVRVPPPGLDPTFPEREARVGKPRAPAPRALPAQPLLPVSTHVAAPGITRGEGRGGWTAGSLRSWVRERHPLSDRHPARSRPGARREPRESSACSVRTLFHRRCCSLHQRTSVSETPATCRHRRPATAQTPFYFLPDSTVLLGRQEYLSFHAFSPLLTALHLSRDFTAGF